METHTLKRSENDVFSDKFESKLDDYFKTNSKTRDHWCVIGSRGWSKGKIGERITKNPS